MRLLLREAVLEYRHQGFNIVRPGDFVRCAVTGEKIHLADLLYWDVETQQPFRDLAAAETYLRLHGRTPPESGRSGQREEAPE